MPSHEHWILTHFHADHYKGLTSRFDKGLIHCTPTTAALVRMQLRVPESRLAVHRLDEVFEVEGRTLRFVDANHCPGAAMVVVEPGTGTETGGPRRAVLHTGDCRLHPGMQQHPALCALRGTADLILDTTYCDPQYTFPPQHEVLEFVLDAVKAESFNPKTLFLFGTYTIGKERLFLEVARQLQLKVMHCLDLDPDIRRLLTTNDQEASLHAVPLWMVTQQHMAKLLKHYRGRFTTVVGFKPTGWVQARESGQTRPKGRRSQRGTLVTYQVPYSEHSSFEELREFVQWFKPLRIVPSVNGDNHGPKSTALVKLLTQ